MASVLDIQWSGDFAGIRFVEVENLSAEAESFVADFQCQLAVGGCIALRSLSAETRFAIAIGYWKLEVVVAGCSVWSLMLEY